MPLLFPVDLEYSDSALVPHPLLGDTHDHIVLVIERNALHSGGELPRIETFAGLN